MPDSSKWTDERISRFHQDFVEHVAKEEAFMESFTQAQERNTKSIEEINNNVTKVIKNTGDIVEAWDNAQGALKFGAGLGRLMKWLSGFAILGVIIDWISSH